MSEKWKITVVLNFIFMSVFENMLKGYLYDFFCVCELSVHVSWLVLYKIFICFFPPSVSKSSLYIRDIEFYL